MDDAFGPFSKRDVGKSKGVKDMEATTKNKQPKLIPFSSLSAAERRVRIAQDVIAALKAKRIIADQGCWCRVEDGNGVELIVNENDVEPDVREVFAKAQSCTVCALGGIFVAAVERFNKLPLSNFFIPEVVNDDGEEAYVVEDFDYGDFVKYLGKFFSGGQLALIENAFELNDGGLTGDIGEAKGQACALWGNQYQTAEERMIAIMRNIIRNEGTFVLPGKFVAQAKADRAVGNEE